MVALEEAAAQAGKGIHAKDKPKPQPPKEEDADTLFRQLKGKSVQGIYLLMLFENEFINCVLAIVEQVRTGTAVRVTILPSRHSIQVFLSGAQSSFKKNENEPKDPIEEAVVAEAKHFVETHVLNREVTLTINGKHFLYNLHALFLVINRLCRCRSRQCQWYVYSRK